MGLLSVGGGTVFVAGIYQELTSERQNWTTVRCRYQSYVARVLIDLIESP